MRSQPRYQPGDKIGGRYQVHQALMGGMGEVYLCLDLETYLPYALKTFQQRFLTNPKLRAAFNSEIATWVALEKHPNIVRCFYMDIIDNQPFMFLEWIASDESRGTDLRSWLQRGPLELRLALDFTVDVCRGLIHAHYKQPGIVHRDIKPENILIAQGRLAKITDWGLAKIVQEAGPEVTDRDNETSERHSLIRAGGIVGTLPYMAPEQWRGEALDARTDIYAVGCIMYEMLTGSWPFRATTVDRLRRQHIEADIPKLADGNILPTVLDTLLAGCLAKQREERFVTVSDLLEQLELIYQQRFSEQSRTIPSGGEYTAIDYYNRGCTYADLQRHEEALADCNRAMQLDPNYAKAYLGRGVIHHKLRRYDRALADHNRAVQLDPADATAYNNRGLTYASLQRHNEALEDYDRAIELDRAYADAYNNRGNLYDTLERYEEALADFTRAIQLDPTYSRAYNNRGLTYQGLQFYQEALADFTRAIQLDPTYQLAYFNRGLTYQNLQLYDEALADYSRAIQLEPTDAKAYMNRGNVYSSLRHHDEALANHTRAIQLAPTYSKAYYNRGLTYHHLAQYDQALADYTRAIQLDPTYSKAYSTIGALLGELGKLHEALPYFEKAAQFGDSEGAQYVAQIRQMSEIESAKEQRGFFGRLFRKRKH